MTAQPVIVLGSEMHLLHSQHTGRTYRITISLPLGYASAPGDDWPFHDPLARWPTVYVLDGNWYFGLVTDIIRPMAWCGSTSDALVVGIGYEEAADPREAFRESFTRRDLDLTPVRDEAVEQSMEAAHKRPVPNGDAGNFHQFIKDELIPFVENAYHADPSRRMLAGIRMVVCSRCMACLKRRTCSRRWSSAARRSRMASASRFSRRKPTPKHTGDSRSRSSSSWANLKKV